MKANVVAYLAAIGVVASFFAGITLAIGSFYSRAPKDGQVPSVWSDDGGLKSQPYRGVRSSADGKWKHVLRKIWFGFLAIDLLVIIIVVVA